MQNADYGADSTKDILQAIVVLVTHRKWIAFICIIHISLFIKVQMAGIHYKLKGLER